MLPILPCCMSDQLVDCETAIDRLEYIDWNAIARRSSRRTFPFVFDCGPSGCRQPCQAKGGCAADPLIRSAYTIK